MSKLLLRRAAPALAVTGAAFTLVIAFDPALLGITATGQSAATATFAEAGTGASTETGTETGTGTQTGTGSGAGTDAATCASASTVTGSSITTRFGPVQVTADVAGSTLCSVHAVTYPEGDPKSAQINAYAIPVLDERASAAGTAFDAVSGATYTSQGYRASLQSILDQL